MNTKDLLELELTTPIDDERPVFVAGNFTEWHPDNANFQLTKVGLGKYQLILPRSILNLPKIEYKYTRGGWEHTELDIFGNRAKNRTINPKKGTQHDFVPYWRNNGQTAYINRLMPIIEVVSEEFDMPQLATSRKISVLLPTDYYENTTKTYPVLYMHDAQNLFGEGSDYGNWEIDKRLSLLANKDMGDVIVVAIEHGNEARFLEFSPYSHPSKGKGRGMRYVNFIVRNLKPFIDTHYRTKPERNFTGIGGSSMGGLISIYAGFMHPEVFGRLMVLSPSLWVSQKIYFDAVEFFNPLATKLYLYGGEKESSFMIPNIEKLKQSIERQGFTTEKLEILLSTDPNGEHNEKRWGQEFPKAIEWLYY